MPRVTTHTASNRGKTYNCTGCGQPIEPGQQYFMWVRRVGPKAGYRRHVACGRPRPTELSSRKTAAVEEAVQDYQTPVLDMGVLDNVPAGEGTLELDVDGFSSAVESVAEVAEGVAEEYEEGVSNMPDQLQYAPTGEAMTDVADRLKEWANDLRDKAMEDLTVDLPAAFEQEGTLEDWRDTAEQAVQDAWDERASEIDELMGEIPEYEG